MIPLCSIPAYCCGMWGPDDMLTWHDMLHVDTTLCWHVTCDTSHKNSSGPLAGVVAGAEVLSNYTISCAAPCSVCGLAQIC